MQQEIEQFLLAKEVDGKATGTIRRYRMFLGAFAAKTGDMPLAAITATTIRTFISDLRKAESHHSGAKIVSGPVSEQTTAGYLRDLRTFFNWCVREDLIEQRANPMRNIKVPGLRQPDEIKAITVESWTKLMAATEENQMGKRDRAILTFLLDTGCRAGGVVHLTPENLFIDRSYAIVHEKGQQTRAVPFSTHTADYLREWLKVRPKHATNVFCAVSDKIKGQPLTTSGLGQIFKRLKKKAGITGRVNPHSFRHAFAREVATASGDIALTSRLLGHSQIGVTMSFYARYTFEEDARQFARFSPLARALGKKDDPQG